MLLAERRHRNCIPSYRPQQTLHHVPNGNSEGFDRGQRHMDLRGDIEPSDNGHKGAMVRSNGKDRWTFTRPHPSCVPPEASLMLPPPLCITNHKKPCEKEKTSLSVLDR
jgi:hypothetical protein